MVGTAETAVTGAAQIRVAAIISDDDRSSLLGIPVGSGPEQGERATYAASRGKVGKSPRLWR